MFNTAKHNVTKFDSTIAVAGSSPPTPITMNAPYLEAHVPYKDSKYRGDYERIHCDICNIRPGHDSVDIHHSLFEGDRMTFHQILTSRDDELDWMRPIRFYNKNPIDSGIKLFDGVIINTKYVYTGSDYMALEVNAAGWWRELARMEFHRPQEYDNTWTVNEIYTDLVRLANDMGVMKEATYEYDTAKIPEYSTYSSHYTTATGVEFTFGNVYEGMQTLTQYLDAVTVCDNLCPEFGLRIESLPRIDYGAGISQTEVKTAIYVLPFPITSYKAVDATFNRFQLETTTPTKQGYTIQRDYKQLANDCYAIGNGVKSRQCRTAKTLARMQLTSSDQDVSFDTGKNTQASHYLRFTVESTTGDKAGWIYVKRVDDGTNYTEKFSMKVPAGGTQIHYTNERTGDGLIHTDCFNFTGFDDCYVTVDEITNDTYPSPNNTTFYTTIAGKSINDYGYAGKTIEAMWLDDTDADIAQQRVDCIAGKHCRLYHAPIHQLSAPIVDRHTTYDNLIVCTADFHSPYSGALDKFLITDVYYGFTGTLVSQRLAGIRYEDDWEYDDV